MTAWLPTFPAFLHRAVPFALALVYYTLRWLICCPLGFHAGAHVEFPDRCGLCGRLKLMAGGL